MGHRIGDRLRSDLVEDHSLGGHLRLQLLQQVPGDRLALTVTVGREQQLVGGRQRILERAQGGPLLGIDDVQRLKAVVDVDSGPRPLLTFVLGGHLGGAGRQIPYVTTARFDDVTVAEKARDLGRLGWRLDDHEPFGRFRCH
jgi:hypothetical protein